MASGYDIASGGDLDTVFAPQHSGWSQAAATEFFDGSGNDLNLRYAVLSTGTAAAATGFVDSAGNDLNTVFAGYGTTGVKVLTQPASVSGSSAAGTPSGTVTSNTTSCAGTKGSGTYTYTWHIASGSGVSFTNPNSATTAVTGTVPASQSTSGTMYCTISDGVTSVNTNTVPWSLQNTSPNQYNVSFTITAASNGSNAIGYSNDSLNGTFGTLNSQSGFPAGASVAECFVFYFSGYRLDIGINCPANPGQSALVSFTFDGHTYTGSGAAAFNYGSGIAQWTWTGVPNLSAGTQYTGTATFTTAI